MPSYLNIMLRRSRAIKSQEKMTSFELHPNLVQAHLEQLLEKAGVKCQVTLGYYPLSTESYSYHEQRADTLFEKTELELKKLPFIGIYLPPFRCIGKKFMPVIKIPNELLESENEGPAVSLPLLASFKYSNFASLTKESKFSWTVEYLQVDQKSRRQPQPGYFSRVQTPFQVNTPVTKLSVVADLPTGNQRDRMRLEMDLKTDQCLDYVKTNLKDWIVSSGRRIAYEALTDSSRSDPSQVMNLLHLLDLYVVPPTGESEDAWKPLDSMDIHEFAGVVWGYLKHHRPLRVSFKLKDIRKVEKEILGVKEAVEVKKVGL